MGVRGPQHVAEAQAIEDEVIGVATAAGEKAAVLDPRLRIADADPAI
jgi:hypothetical protein